MYQTYQRIFDRMLLNYKVVLADTGAIGGNGSHQFMAISDVGESDIIYCDCGYAADQEKAENKTVKNENKGELLVIEEVSTPNQKTIEEVSSFLNVDARSVCKSMVYYDIANNRYVLVMVRGDREVNEIKVVNALDIAEHELVLASASDIEKLGSCEGFVGPYNFNDNVIILIDDEVCEMTNIVVGANKKDVHLKNVNYGRDFNGTVAQFRKTVAGDICPVCGKKLAMERGIEVGQIFKLGTKYSASMKCCYQNDNGELTPMVMGCYGIGVTRTMSAIIEQYHDDYGIKWPLNVAPYHAVVVPINYNDENMKTVADKLYCDLKANGVEVILDDRDDRPGFKFKDWELIGIPYMIIAGKRACEGIVELKNRHTLEKVEVTIEEAVNIISNEVRKIK